MSGIICWACLILAISVLQFALLQWRSEFNKNQEKNESQQNQGSWWIQQRECFRSFPPQGCRRTYHPRLQQARWREVMEIKIPQSSIAKKEDRSGETWYRHRPIERFLPQILWAIHGKFLLSMLLKVGWWPFLVFSSVENWLWAFGSTRWNFLENETRNSTWFLSWGNPSWRNRAISCEWGNTPWKTGETRCRFSRRSMASTIRHWKRWSRLRIVSRIKIIRESGEWIRCD